MGLPRGLSINYLHPNLKGSLGALSATIATNRTDAGPAVTSVGQQLSAVGALVGSVAKPSAQNAAATLSELTLQTAGLAYVAILERSIQKTLTLGTFNLDIAISRLTEALQVLITQSPK